MIGFIHHRLADFNAISIDPLHQRLVQRGTLAGNGVQHPDILPPVLCMIGDVEQHARKNFIRLAAIFQNGAHTFVYKAHALPCQGP